MKAEIFSDDMLEQEKRIGPYTLIRQIGRGAFGTVWLAERRSSITVTKVALKISHDDNVDLQTVKNEASVWAEASGHPNVLSIIEADVYDGRVAIVSEFAHDGSLETKLASNGSQLPDILWSIEIILGILAGLNHLHTRGIIHRDLKPANILFQGDTPRLADFGVSRVLMSTAQTATSAGTPSYMAPETFEGERSEQTDIWSIGVIFYRLLTGRLPFESQDFPSLWAAIAMKDPDPLPDYVPESVKYVVKKALTKDPRGRFNSAIEMRTILRTAAASYYTPTSHDQLTVPLYRPDLSATVRKSSWSTLAWVSSFIGIIAIILLSSAAYFVVANYFPPISSSSEAKETQNSQLAPTPPLGMAFVPGGDFMMGSDDNHQISMPAHKETVKPFFMDVTEVTNEQYKKFVDETGHKPPPSWKNGTYPARQAQYPVTGANWYDAKSFCESLEKRLPTEQEWEFAARGTDGLLYPWGDKWDPAVVNSGGSRGLQEVGKAIKGKSPFGLLDMSGNVWEWTSSDSRSYEGSQTPFIEKDTKIIRGGSWMSSKEDVTTVVRKIWSTTRAPNYAQTGFRCVKNLSD